MDTSRSVTPVRHILTPDLLLLSKLFAHTNDAVCAIDANQRILYWNRTAEITLGYAAAEVMGQPCYQTLQGQTPDGIVFCRQNCPLFQEAKAAVACPCRILSLKDGRDCRRLFCVSTLAVTKECRQHAAPILIHLWRSLTLPYCTSAFYSAGSPNAKRLYLIQALRLELESLLAREQSDKLCLTPV